MSNTTETATIKSPVRPSKALRRHFLSLGRQIVRWSEDRTPDTVSIGVTCLERRTGTSTVTFNLAAAVGSIVERDVLYVESDFGNPYLFRSRKGKVKGFAEALRGELESKEAIAQLENEKHLFAIGPGQTKESESVELPLNNLRHLMLEQLTQFDFALFDLPVSDGLSACDTLASQLDGIILVVDANDMDQRRIESFRNRMQRLGVEIIGLVINKA